MNTQETVEPADMIITMEQTIKESVEKIDRLTSEIKKLTEMMQSSFMNDEAFRKADIEVKRLTLERKKIKFQIMQIPAIKEVYEKLMDAKSEKRELKDAQSDYLREYQRLSGATQLELFDGSTMEIVPMYKMIKRSKRT